MKERLKQDLEQAFKSAPHTQKNQDLKEEILSNLYDKYDACVESGKSPEEAYRETVESIGDLSALFEKSEAPNSPLYGDEERAKKKTRHDGGIATAVMLYILSVLPVILWDGVPLAVVGMFFMVAAATGILLYVSGTKPILVSDELNTNEREKLRRTRSIRAILLAVSVMLYILCVCPVILIPNEKIGTLCMFITIALATGIILYRGLALPLSAKTSEDPVLKDIPEQKEKKTPLGIFFSILSGIYWFLAVAAYFIFSFATGRWGISWLIFLYAALFYAIVHGVWQLIVAKKKAGPIVKIVICSILLFAIFTPTLLLGEMDFRFAFHSFHTYDDDGYSTGNVSLAPEQAVTALEVDWIEGDVRVVYWDEGYVSVKEETNELLDAEDQLRYLYSNGKLSVKFAASKNYSLGNLPTKHLTVYLPRSTELDRMALRSVSGAVSAEGVCVSNLLVQTASGNVTLKEIRVRDLEFNTVSGELNLSLLNTPEEISIDNVSGNVNVTLPSDFKGFELEYDSVSGKLTLPEGVSHHEDEASYGDRSCEFGFDSISGNLSVQIASPVQS